MSRETFAAARLRLHAALARLGWRVSSPDLKRLWCEAPGAEFRLWFTSQAVYLNDRSLFVDMRGMSEEDLVAHVFHMRSDLEPVTRRDTPKSMRVTSMAHSHCTNRDCGVCRQGRAAREETSS